MAERQKLEAEEEAKKLLAPQSSADEYGRLYILACDTAKRAEIIRGSMTPEFTDANQLQMEREAQEEAPCYLHRMAIIRPAPLDPLEPVRDA